MKTIRLSSNWTLFLKIFLPIAWLSFFGSFFLGSFLANPIEVPQLTSITFRSSISLFILGGIAFFYFTLFRLKRVDADANFVFVSNYFKTLRYTFDSIDKMVLHDHFLFKAVHIHLKERGKFGKRIIFIPKMIHFNIFIESAKLEELLQNPN